MTRITGAERTKAFLKGFRDNSKHMVWQRENELSFKAFMMGEYRRKTSTHPTKRSRKVTERRRKNQISNRAIRSQLYQEYRGESGKKDHATWHRTLHALSNGNAGG
jgi:hypothetical protein